MKFNYAEHSLQSGIYKITNIHTNRIYIGQAKRFKERWAGHKSSLIANKHQNKFLLSDFNKCKEVLGHDNFLEFDVLEVMVETTKEQRNVREEWWIQKLLEQQNLLYNFRLEPTKEARNWSNTPEKAIERMKKAQQTRWSGAHSGKAREQAKIRAKKMWQDANYLINQESSRAIKNAKISQSNTGKTKPQNIKLKMSEASKKKWNNAQYAARMSAVHKGQRPWNRGQKYSQIAGIKHYKAKTYVALLVSPSGEFYKVECLTEFCRTHNLAPSCLCNLLNGKRKSHKGWKLFNQSNLLY